VNQRHLDLGCGSMPRNPFGASDLFGIDIVDIFGEEYQSADFLLKIADLSQEAIPFESNYFDSISAYDFLEHIPRYSLRPDGESFSPFIQLMSEIYRVLVPGGHFLASTPAYPSEAVFVDPTHVNFISIGTARYFSGPEPYARRYGFKGSFNIIENHFDAQKNAHNPSRTLFEKRMKNFRKKIKRQLTHITWRFQAVK